MKSKYDLVLFDLDGTLTNSGKGIINSVKSVLKDMGKPVPSDETLRGFIGPPIYDSFRSVCHMSAEESEKGINRYRQIYNSSGLFDNEVYSEIPELLSSLKKAGVCLAVATSKPVTPTRRILEHFGLSRYFQYISAENDSEHGGGKEILINRALNKLVIPPEKTVMIGDTKFDAAGARKAGTYFIGVLYGFGFKEEMAREGAERFAESPAELKKILFKI